MKKGTKDKPKLIGKQAKEFVPSSYPHLRENIPITPPNQLDREYKPSNPPRILPKDFNLTSVTELLTETGTQPNAYQDPEGNHIFLPYSLYTEYLNKEVKWSRPEEYIKENILDKEITMRFPNRNKYKFKEKIKEMYEKEKEERESGMQKKIDSNEDFFNEEARDKYSLYRDFFSIINSTSEIRVVNFYSREETNEEYETRMKNEEEAKAKKDPKMKNVPSKTKTSKVDEPIDKKIIKSISPSNISMKDSYPVYCRWLASIFQVIKDRNIVDVFTNETIWQKIYPQEDGVPIYNSKGHYIVKLYHMGQLKQIEIDDLMPCSKFEEFYLPKCDTLNEIWPAILTKAIIKLYSYKIVSNSFQELGEYEAFYALTGLYPRMIDVVLKDKLTADQSNIVKEVLIDDNYINQRCYLLSYRKEEKTTPKEDTFISQQRMYSTKSPIKLGNKTLFARKTNRTATLSMRGSQSIIDIQQMKQNNKLPSQLSRLIEEIEVGNSSSRKKFVKRKSINSTKIILSLKQNKLESEKEEDTPSKWQSNRLSVVNQQVEKPKMEKYENKIFIGLLYDVIEYFDNKEYNMNRLKPIDFSDLKDMVKQLNTTYIFKQLSREEKKIYVENLKDIKQKQKAEKTKRIEALKLKGFSFKCIKIRNFSVEEPKFYIPYTDEEIEMTKKCLLNNWEFPPMDYLDQIYEDKMKFDILNLRPNSPHKRSSISNRNSIFQSPNKILGFDKKFIGDNKHQLNEEGDEMSMMRNSRTWSKEAYMHLIDNNLEQYQNSNEPVIRPKGTWVSPDEFFHCFNSFLVLVNPRLLKNSLVWDNIWYDTNDDFNIDNSKKIIHISLNDDQNIQIIPFLTIVFAANSDKMNKLKDIPYQINFSLFEANRTTKIGENNNEKKEIKFLSKFAIKSFFDTKHFRLDPTKDYFLRCEGGIYPNGFFLEIRSNFKMEGMSEINYLTQHLKYQRTTYKIEHGLIEKNRPYQLFKLLIKISKPMKLMIFTNQKDNYSRNYTELSLIKTKSNNKIMIDFNYMFTIDNAQGDDEYIITIIITPPYNVQDESYDLDLIYDDQESTNTLTQIDNLPPYDIFDYYIPNKHYVLFQEYIFAGDKIYAMINVKLINLIKEENNQNAIDTKDNKSIANKSNKDKESMNQLKQIPVEENIRMKMLIFNKENELISSYDFFNEITIRNFIFEGNMLIDNKKGATSNPKGGANKEDVPPGNLPYLLKCYMDKTELPKKYQSADNLNGLGWNIRVFSSDTLAFCRDTAKEDRERAMINSWETSEPGRAERAQQSRRRFLLKKKKLSGMEIVQEDEEFLAIPYIRKVALQTTKGNQPDTATRNKNIKDSKSKTQNMELEQVKIIKEDLNWDHKLPDIYSHASLFVKNFLFYTLNERLVQYDHNYPQEEKIFNDENVTQEKVENILSVYENSVKKNTVPANTTFFKTQLVDKNKQIYQKVIKTRQEEVKAFDDLMTKREKIMAELAAKKEAERKLKEIIQATKEKIDEKDTKNKFDINAYVQVYQEVIDQGFKLDLINEAHEAISKKKEEIIMSQFKKIANGKEKEFKPSAIKHLEDINKHKWIISDEIINKLEELVK